MMRHQVTTEAIAPFSEGRFLTRIPEVFGTRVEWSQTASWDGPIAPVSGLPTVTVVWAFIGVEMLGYFTDPRVAVVERLFLADVVSWFALNSLTVPEGFNIHMSGRNVSDNMRPSAPPNVVEFTSTPIIAHPAEKLVSCSSAAFFAWNARSR